MGEVRDNVEPDVFGESSSREGGGDGEKVGEVLDNVEPDGVGDSLWKNENLLFSDVGLGLHIGSVGLGLHIGSENKPTTLLGDHSGCLLGSCEATPVSQTSGLD
jgi:hypothetical protein